MDSRILRSSSVNQQRQIPPDLILDYQITIDLIKTLTDIRFKLLAFVPTISGFAVAFVGHDPDNFIALGIGVLGFAVTLGIVLYDQRNSQIYNLCMHRAIWLEHLLSFPKLTDIGWRKPYTPTITGGSNTERPYLKRKLFKQEMLLAKHDYALALIYGASLAGWAFLIAQALGNVVLIYIMTLFTPHITVTGDTGIQTFFSLLSLGFATLVGVIFVKQLIDSDSSDADKPNGPANDIPPPSPQQLVDLRRRYTPIDLSGQPMPRRRTRSKTEPLN